MKKLLAILILLGSFIVSAVYGNENALSQFKQVSQQNPNHIYFGPEAFLFDLNTHFKGVKVDGTKFFLGLSLGYEYLKPKTFYFGIDLMSFGGNKGFKDSYKGLDFPKSGGLTGFGNLELRFGYTFSPKKWFAIPFLGIGGYSFGYGSNHHHFKEGISYLAGGLHSQYEVIPTFNVGLNLKILGSIYTEEKFRFLELKSTTHHGLWGGEIGVPLIWLVGSSKRWNIRFEPYFLNLNFSEIQNIYGIRLIFGYHF